MLVKGRSGAGASPALPLHRSNTHAERAAGRRCCRRTHAEVTGNALDALALAIAATAGNPDCHVILRGGKAPNYDAESVAAACKELEAAKLPATLMVDCSHANSSKKHERQIDVAKDIAVQISGGSRQVFGVMVESHLVDGAQKFTPGQHDVAKLTYGQSITDACIGWDDSEGVLQVLSDAVKARRAG